MNAIIQNAQSDFWDSFYKVTKSVADLPTEQLVALRIESESLKSHEDFSVSTSAQVVNAAVTLRLERK